MTAPRLCPHCDQPVRGRCRRCRNTRYGQQHQTERARWEPIVALGQTPCARGQWCGEPHLLDPAELWHLDHLDGQRQPSCARRNDEYSGQ